MPTRVIIIGGGGHAQALEDALSLLGGFDMIGFTDLKGTIHRMRCPYLGDDSVITRYSTKEVFLVNAIGSSNRVPLHREQIYTQFTQLGYSFQSVIHPSAVISPRARLASGVQIMPGVVVNIDAEVGENTLINTQSSVDHGCRIGAHCHIAPGVTLSGDVTIGATCHIGTGATVIQGVTIGDHTLIAAGAVVVKDMPSGVVALGIPARIRPTSPPTH